MCKKPSMFSLPSAFIRGAALALLFSSISTTAQAAMPTFGLIGHWPLNGNANDISGQGNHGMIVGATAATGVTGGAFSFDGNDQIILPNFQFPGSTFTVSIWVQTTNPVVGFDFRSMFDQLSNSEGSPFELVDGGNSSGANIGPTFASWNGGATVVLLSQPALNVRNGRWHMVTGTYRNGLQWLYVDGAKMKVSTFAGPLPTSSIGASIGGHNFGPFHHPWIGRLDEAVIYNRALSPVEVLRLYQAIDPPPLN